MQTKSAKCQMGKWKTLSDERKMQMRERHLENNLLQECLSAVPFVKNETADRNSIPHTQY
jgi:hypothetical protein